MCVLVMHERHCAQHISSSTSVGHSLNVGTIDYQPNPENGWKMADDQLLFQGVQHYVYIMYDQ